MSNEPKKKHKLEAFLKSIERNVKWPFKKRVARKTTVMARIAILFYIIYCSNYRRTKAKYEIYTFCRTSNRKLPTAWLALGEREWMVCQREKERGEVKFVCKQRAWSEWTFARNGNWFQHIYYTSSAVTQTTEEKKTYRRNNVTFVSIAVFFFVFFFSLLCYFFYEWIADFVRVDMMLRQRSMPYTPFT